MEQTLILLQEKNTQLEKRIKELEAELVAKSNTLETKIEGRQAEWLWKNQIDRFLEFKPHHNLTVFKENGKLDENAFGYWKINAVGKLEIMLHYGRITDKPLNHIFEPSGFDSLYKCTGIFYSNNNRPYPDHVADKTIRFVR